MVKIRELVWDEWNKNHVQKHGVKPEEVEEVCGRVLKSFKSYDERVVVLGKTNRGRLLTVILAQKKKETYYPVTARDVSKKERRLIK